ncbi:MAG: hypothetical protein JW888_04300, partial [Pirellulales bacterium]|nr:hypothetical protein [Pirellulales bacterium]
GGMGGGMMGGGMGGGFMNVEDICAQVGGDGVGGTPARSTPNTVMDSLLQVITMSVTPDSWQSMGGEGHVEPFGTSLVVRQTPTIHKQIQDLLQQLRQGSGKRKPVAVDARWLLLDSDELDRLMSLGKTGQSKIDRDALAEFTRRPTSIRGQTNCFTGQLVYLVGGTRRNVVSGYIPVVGSVDRPERQASRLASLSGGARVTFASQHQNNQVSNGGSEQRPSREASVGYQPIIEKPNFGTLLEIRPTLIPHDNTAVVDLRSTITVAGTRTAAADSNPNGRLVPQVDRIAIETQELATTLTVPLGQPTLVGGLTYVTDASPSGRARDNTRSSSSPERSETPQLYLILELR